MRLTGRIGLAVLGVVLAAAIALAASRLVSQPIGLSSEPVTAGSDLAPAPAPASAPAKRPRNRTRTTPTTATTTTTTTAPPVVTTRDDEGGGGEEQGEASDGDD
jgi:hypothetical protein